MDPVTLGMAKKAMVDSTGRRLNTFKAISEPEAKRGFTARTTLTPGKSVEAPHPKFQNPSGDLITRTALNMPTIQTMRAFVTDGVIGSPLGRIYGYVCTDHDSPGTPEPYNGKGGWKLVYANNLRGPFTEYKPGGVDKVWQYTAEGNQTETPDPIAFVDDPDGKPVYIYFQQQGTGANQSTYLVKSVTGLPDDPGAVVVGRVIAGKLTRPGDGQTTYATMAYYDRILTAIHLMGGGDWAHYGRSFSRDGANFVTHPHRFGHGSDKVGADNARRLSIRSVFRWRGQWWAIATVGSHTSGFVTAPRQGGVIRMKDDLSGTIGNFYPFEDQSIGAGCVVELDGELGIYYRSGDAYSAFKVATAEA